MERLWKVQGRGKVVEGALLLCDEYALYGCKPCRLFLCARTLMCRDSIMPSCAFSLCFHYTCIPQKLISFVFIFYTYPACNRIYVILHIFFDVHVLVNVSLRKNISKMYMMYMYMVAFSLEPE